MANCKSCQAPIRWELTVTGRNIPLDAEPVLNGNLIFDENGRIVTVEPRASKLAYISHFATCPQAAKHRKAR